MHFGFHQEANPIHSATFCSLDRLIAVHWLSSLNSLLKGGKNIYFRGMCCLSLQCLLCLACRYSSLHKARSLKLMSLEYECGKTQENSLGLTEFQSAGCYFTLFLFSLLNFIWPWWLIFLWLWFVLFQVWGCLGNTFVILIPEGVVVCDSSIPGFVSRSAPPHSDLLPTVTLILLRFGKLTFFFFLFAITT